MWLSRLNKTGRKVIIMQSVFLVMTMDKAYITPSNIPPPSSIHNRRKEKRTGGDGKRGIEKVSIVTRVHRDTTCLPCSCWLHSPPCPRVLPARARRKTTPHSRDGERHTPILLVTGTRKTTDDRARQELVDVFSNTWLSCSKLCQCRDRL